MRLPTLAFLSALLYGCNSEIGPLRLAPDQALVLYSRTDPANVQSVECGADRCVRLALEDVLRDPANCDPQPRRTIVLSGDALEPTFLGHTAAEIARALRCVGDADLLVLDICYGATTSLLSAIAQNAARPVTVAAIEPLPARGLLYDPGVFGAAAAPERASLVQSRDGGSLQRFLLHPPLLAAAQGQVDALPAAELSRALRHINPNLVTVQVGIPTADLVVAGLDTVDLLVPVPAERFR